MAYFLFSRGGNFSESLGESVGYKNRIVAKSVRPAPFADDLTAAKAFRHKFISPALSAIAIAHTKRASRCRWSYLPISRKSFSMFASSLAFSPAYLAEKTPGAPFKAATSRPESSARDHKSVCRAYARAFKAEFSANVLPVSSTSADWEIV
jgi:hypothetical protein